MNYNEKITILKEKLDKAFKGQENFRTHLKNIKIGDTVHEGGSYGDFHPQIVKEIDIEGCRILTLEKSINKLEWVNSFYVQDEDGKFNWIH